MVSTEAELKPTNFFTKMGGNVLQHIFKLRVISSKKEEINVKEIEDTFVR